MGSNIRRQEVHNPFPTFSTGKGRQSKPCVRLDLPPSCGKSPEAPSGGGGGVTAEEEPKAERPALLGGGRRPWEEPHPGHIHLPTRSPRKNRPLPARDFPCMGLGLDETSAPSWKERQQLRDGGGTLVSSLSSQASWNQSRSKKDQN